VRTAYFLPGRPGAPDWFSFDFLFPRTNLVARIDSFLGAGLFQPINFAIAAGLDPLDRQDAATARRPFRRPTGTASPKRRLSPRRLLPFEPSHPPNFEAILGRPLF
jgi:hypothetical protein